MISAAFFISHKIFLNLDSIADVRPHIYGTHVPKEPLRGLALVCLFNVKRKIVQLIIFIVVCKGYNPSFFEKIVRVQAFFPEILYLGIDRI